MEAVHLSEPSLVRLVVNALQGVESALRTIEKLSPLLLLTSADRTSHRIPDLWSRCSSTVALGNLLNSIGQFGCIVFLLRRFVDYFTKPETYDVIENDKHLEDGSLHKFGLINQAFAIAVGKFIGGYISALNTLSASVTLRRSSKINVEGCLTGIGYPEITLLEVCLHTAGLKTQMEALGNLCNVNKLSISFPASSLEELRIQADKEFTSFPRSGALLSFLYAQLKVADPENCALLKFLFLNTYEPYNGFIRSWIYEGTTSDPYNEFVVHSTDNKSMYAPVDSGTVSRSPLSIFMVQDEADVPCFLENCLVPLLRTGQQLQVIMKLLELSNIVGSCDAQEEILPSVIGLSTKHPWFTVPFTFDKESIEAMVHMRTRYYEQMFGEIEGITNKFEFRIQQAGQQSVTLGIRNNYGQNSHHITSSPVHRSSRSQSEGNIRTTLNCIMDSEASSVTDEYSFTEDNFKSSDGSSSDSSGTPNENKKLDVDSPGVEANSLSDLLSPLILSNNSVKTQYESDNPCFLEGFGSNLKCEMSLGKPENGFELASGSIGLLNTEFDSSIDASWVGESNKDHDQFLPCLDMEMSAFENWKQRYDSEFFSSNRILKHSCFFNPSVMPSAVKCYTDSNGLSLDFGTVNDPVKSFVVKLVDDVLPKNTGFTLARDEVPASSGDTLHCPEVKNNDEISKEHGAILCSVKSSVAVNENQEECALLNNISGGSSWESLLGRFNYNVKNTAPIHRHKLVAAVDLPLDFAIKNSWVDEISLQYQYISKLMIKLLTEGFKLQEHLQALRCFHFMELADWADLFIMSLQHHKWHDNNVDNRIPEVQRALELAIQRSSCEENPNKDRLHVYIKEDHIKHFAACATGINTFKFLGLGYQIEWPVTMILTPAALTIYSDIFNFLIQVKLAIFLLTDAWTSLKCISSAQYKGDSGQLVIMAGIRHMIYHFVSTLLQYVQVQLSQISWNRFLHSMKFKVTDMFDLESRLMDYLVESLQICFLSNGTKPIAAVVQSILQCAMDYHSCVTGRIFKAITDEKVDRIDILQMHSIKRTFMKNLEELHSIHLKSLKTSDFALCRLWDLLDYNDYYADVMNKQFGNCLFY